MIDLADKLDAKIETQIAARNRILQRIRWLEKKAQYRNQRIRKLSAQRTIELNMKLAI